MAPYHVSIEARRSCWIVATVVAAVSTLPFHGLPIRTDRPLQCLQDEPHFLPGLFWSIRDGIHLSHQLFRGDRYILLSEEAFGSSIESPRDRCEPRRQGDRPSR